MPTTLPTESRNAAAQAITDRLNAGSGPGVIKIFDASNVLLASHELSDPAVSDITAGVATFDVIGDDVDIDADGTADHYSAQDSDGNEAFAGNVGTSGASLNFDSVSFVAGGTARITSFTITMPGS